MPYLHFQNYNRAVELLVELATLQTCFITLDEAIKITNRRVNAIEHVIIPKIENTLTSIGWLAQTKTLEFHSLISSDRIGRNGARGVLPHEENPGQEEARPRRPGQGREQRLQRAPAGRRPAGTQYAGPRGRPSRAFHLIESNRWNMAKDKTYRKALQMSKSPDIYCDFI